MGIDGVMVRFALMLLIETNSIKLCSGRFCIDDSRITLHQPELDSDSIAFHKLPDDKNSSANKRSSHFHYPLVISREMCQFANVHFLLSLSGGCSFAGALFLFKFRCWLSLQWSSTPFSCREMHRFSVINSAFLILISLTNSLFYNRIEILKMDRLWIQTRIATAVLVDETENNELVSNFTGGSYSSRFNPLKIESNMH